MGRPTAVMKIVEKMTGLQEGTEPTMLEIRRQPKVPQMEPSHTHQISKMQSEGELVFVLFKKIYIYIQL